MRYAIITKTADGETNIVKYVDALNAKTVFASMDENGAEDEKTLVIPCTVDKNGNADAYGIFKCAVQVATKASKRMLDFAPTDTQRRIANELSVINAKIGASAEAENFGASYVLTLLSQASADTQDFTDIAINSVTDSVSKKMSLYEQYHNAFLAINAENSKLKTRRIKEVSTEYITDNDGQIVALSSQIARILRSDEKYTPSASSELSADNVEKIGNAFKAFAPTLTERQKTIFSLTARGYSQRQIQEKLKFKAIRTVTDHLCKIRVAFIAYAEQNAPDILTLVNIKEVHADNKKRNADKHINNDKRKKANAERMKKYRERKKAEKASNNGKN